MLSIVITTRNDDHGGNMIHRLQRCVGSFAEHWKRQSWDMELVLVEWNPPADRPPLIDELEVDGGFPLRVITVPHEIHAMLENSDKMRIFYAIGQNVGVRHSKGDWVLVTGQDVIFSNELAHLLATEELDKKCVYRMGRYDITSRTVPGDGLDDWLEFCEGNKDCLHNMSNEPLLTNAAGDFLLMHRDSWTNVRGYLELPMQCLHMDGVLLNMASASGLREVVLDEEFYSPLIMYHIYHGGCYYGDPEFVSELPKMTYGDHYAPMTENMRFTGELVEINDENWGFAESTLREVGPAQWVLADAVLPSLIPLDEARDKLAQIALEMREERMITCTAREARTREFEMTLDPAATAVVVVDMWDTHWCEEFTKWVDDLAPRLNQALHGFRERGLQVIHAVADVLGPYKDAPQYTNVRSYPHAEGYTHGKLEVRAPGRWPIGGCLCETICESIYDWTRIHPDIDIADDDLIIGWGTELHNICAARGFSTLLYCGIATNQCVLDTRQFSMVPMKATGYDVVLLRDLTEALVPRTYRAEGLRLSVRFIERFVAPTILASQLLEEDK